MCYETCCYEKMNDWFTHYFLTPIYKMLKENGFVFREFIILAEFNLQMQQNSD